MVFRTSKQSVFQISLSFVLTVACFSCAHDFVNDFEGDGDPIVETGVDCKGSETQSVSNLEPRLGKSSTKDSSLICKMFSGLSYCNKPKALVAANTSDSTCIAKTNFCKVDEFGMPVSQDYMTTAGGSTVTGTIGGCINRPIREVWATLVNFGAMLPDPVDRFAPTQRKDLEDPDRQMFYVIDFQNIKGSFIGDIKWDVQYRYKVSKGSYQAPRQIAVNYQRISGTSFVEKIKGGYVLDRVNDNVTSFVMSQAVKAAQYSENDMGRDLTTDLRKARTAEPLWANLPDQAPALTLDFSNVRM